MKRNVIVACFLAVCFWCTPRVNCAELRTWTSESGKFTVKAELLSLDEGVVSLRRDNGKTLKVPLAKLSQEDQEYVLADPKSKADLADALAEESVAALEKLGARIERDGQGKINSIAIDGPQFTDAGLVHLKGLTKLENLMLGGPQVTDAGLVHLKGLTHLKRLFLGGPQVTDAGVVELQTALPNCTIVPFYPGWGSDHHRRNQPAQPPRQPNVPFSPGWGSVHNRRNQPAQPPRQPNQQRPGKRVVSVSSNERIHDYHSHIQVLQDGSLRVTETITVTALGKQIKRGIYRDFPTHYETVDQKQILVPFEVVSVKRDGKSEQFHQKNRSNGVRVYIGKKNYRLPPGNYTYELTYTTNFQLGYFEAHDELYFNVTGNGWEFAIDRAAASVSLPAEVSRDKIQHEGYTGRQGSKATNLTSTVSQATGNVEFETTQPLKAREGLTIVVGFPKGLVQKPSAGDLSSAEQRRMAYSQRNAYLRAFEFNWKFQGSLFQFLTFLMVVIYYGIAWHHLGRDPPDGTIYPIFEPPLGLPPACVRYLRRMKYDTKCFSAAVLDMAVKGHLKIQVKRGIWHLHRSSEAKIAPLSPGEKKIFKVLLWHNTSLALENFNHKKISKAMTTLKKSLSKEYHRKLFFKNKWWLVPGWLLSCGSIYCMRWPYDLGACECFVFTGLLISNVLFGYLMGRPTLEGRRVMDQIEGFRMYLETAEGELLNQLHPPELTPERFEKYLPYALALDVEIAWSEKFSWALEDAATGPGDNDHHRFHHSWYEGRNYDTHNFAYHLSQSMNTAISSASTPPGSSGGGGGGGGGGSSGGGGGGGGGGGW